MTNFGSLEQSPTTMPLGLPGGHFFSVQVEQFKGPIDLLLHLVKTNELPIEKISLAQICGQYMACLEQMRQLDLELAGEYLVIAATLLSIKSSILLNDPIELIENEDGNLVDPHEELLRKLREAEVYKEGARFLGNCDQLDQDVFQGVPGLEHVGSAAAPLKQHDPLGLARAFRKILEGIDSQALVYEVSVDSVSIVERMMWVLDKMRAGPTGISFIELIPDITSRAAVISSFIALLELCRRQVIYFKQDDSYADIQVFLAGDGTFDFSGMTSEFDTDLDEQPKTANA